MLPVETMFSQFEFWSLGLVMCGKTLSSDAGEQAPAPHKPHSHEGEQLVHPCPLVPR